MDLFRAVSSLRRMRIFPEVELIITSLTEHLDALSITLTSAEGEKCGLATVW
jgi:hypothetical protein